jgi:hypothetical protein
MPAIKRLADVLRSLRWFDFLAVVASVWGLYNAMVPGMNPVSGVFAAGYDGSPILRGLCLAIVPPWSLWWLVGFGWLLWAANPSFPCALASPVRPWHRWLSPALALVFWGLLLMDLPLRLAFPFHRSALVRLVAQADEAPQEGEHANCRVGLYPVKGVFESIEAPKELQRPSDRRYVAVEHLSVLAPYGAGGFVYDPKQRIRGRRLLPSRHWNLDWMYMHTIPLGGGWYAYVLLDDD